MSRKLITKKLLPVFLSLLMITGVLLQLPDISRSDTACAAEDPLKSIYIGAYEGNFWAYEGFEVPCIKCYPDVDYDNMYMYNSYDLPFITLYLRGLSAEQLDDLKLTWTSSNPSVAEYDAKKDKILSLRAGTTKFRVTAENGVYSEFDFTVKKPDIHLSFSDMDNFVLNGIMILRNERVDDRGNICDPEDYNDEMIGCGLMIPMSASFDNIKVLSSNEKVVKIENNKIYAVSPGQADLYVINTLTGATFSKSKVTVPEVTVDICKYFEIDPGEKIEYLHIGATTVPLRFNDGYFWAESDRKKCQENYNYLDDYYFNHDQNFNRRFVVSLNKAGTERGDFTLTSSDPGIVRVTENTIEGVSKGKAVITATLPNGNTAKCNVTVTRSPKGISLDSEEYYLYKGKTKKFRPIISPDDADNKTITWSTNYREVISIKDGIITGLDYGTAYVTAYTIYGRDNYCEAIEKQKATFKIHVVKEETGITLSRSEIALKKGSQAKLKAVIQPSDAYFKEINWTSTDSNVAIVTNGYITALNPGTTTIIAETHNHKIAQCKVTVKGEAKSVRLNKTSLTLGKGESLTITGTVEPANSLNSKLTWTTSNSSVATVSNGTIKARGTGTATITAKTSNGKTATCKVTVKSAPSKITLTKGILTIGVGEKYSLGSSVNDGAGCATRTYRTSNSSVVKMTKTNWTGDFVGVKPGVAYVTVRSYNGKEHSCKVTVKPAPKSVTISKKTLTMKVGQTATLSCWTNDGAGCAKRTFRTSNSSIVKMTKTNWTGSFKAMKPGVAWVTVRTYNGKESSCKVTVIK